MRPTDEHERFWSKVDASGDCWLWTSHVIRNGYGAFALARNGNKRTRHVTAHRFAYGLLVGPIPSGMTLDHLCRVKTCVNPDHLEPVSLIENNRRAPTTHAGRTHCKHGHPFDAANTVLVPRTHRGQPCMRRRCRECFKAYLRTHYQRMGGYQGRKQRALEKAQALKTGAVA